MDNSISDKLDYEQEETEGTEGTEGQRIFNLRYLCFLLLNLWLEFPNQNLLAATLEFVDSINREQKEGDPLR